MKKILCCLSFVFCFCCAFYASAQNTVIDFDDLTSGTAIPSGYGGFNWDAGVVSTGGPHSGTNHAGYSFSPGTVTKVSGSFTLVEIWVKGSPGTVDVTGYKSGGGTVTTSFTVNGTYAKKTFANFNNLTSVVFDMRLYNDWYIDDFTYSDDPEINLVGNGNTIDDGETTPSAADDTDFGSYDVGAGSISNTFTIQNTGESSLSLTGTPLVALSNGTDFTITQPSPTSPLSIAAGGSTTFAVAFDPTTTGTKTDTISIANNDADENPYTFVITGEGISSSEINLKQGSTNIADGGSHDFGDKALDSNNDLTFTIENNGTGALSLTGTPDKVSITGADAGQFSIDETGTTSPVAASGGTTTFTIRFKPTTTGDKTATITIANNDSNEDPYNFTITGKGIPATAEMNLKQGATDIADGGSYDFGLQTHNTNTDIVFTIENLGATNLTLTTPLTITGADAGQFTVQEDPSSTELAYGETTTFTVRFTPTSEGGKTATIAIGNNDNNENTYDLNLNGSGTPNTYIYFDDITTEATASVPSPYKGFTGWNAVKRDGIPGFTPNSPSGEYQVTQDYRAHEVSIVSGTFNLVELQAALYIAGVSTTVTVTGYINGGGTVSESFTLTSTNYSKQTFTTLNNLTKIEFTASAVGRDWCFDDFAYNQAKEINLTGKGNDIADGDTTPSTTDDTDFGSYDIWAGSVSHTFTIQNTGSSALSLTGTPLVTLSDSTDFTITQPSSSSLAAGGSTTFTIAFDPTTTGTKTDTVSIANDDSDENPYTFVIKGEAIASSEMNIKQGTTPVADNSGSHNFGIKPLNSNTDVTFTIENLGSAALDLTGTPDKVVITGTDAGQFSVETDATSTVDTLGSTTFTVRFTPTTTGDKTAVISIANDDPDENPYNFTITGKGIPATAEMNLKQGTTGIADGGTYDFGRETNNTNTDITFTIENLGATDLTLTTPFEITGADAGQFSIQTQPSLTTLAYGDSTTFTVRFTPTSEGGKTATIAIGNNDSDENTYDLAITGTGTIHTYVDFDDITTEASAAAPSGYKGFSGWGTVKSDASTGLNSPSGNYQSTYYHNLTHISTISGTFNLISLMAARDPSSGNMTVDVKGYNGSTEVASTSFTLTSTTYQTITFTGFNNLTKITLESNIHSDSWYIDEFAFNKETEINIVGNGNDIVNRDVFPSTSDGTDFGSHDIGAGSITHTFTIENGGSKELTLTGANPVAHSNATDFTITQPDSSSLLQGNSCPFTISFDPVTTGIKRDTITIANNDPNDNPYIFLVHGEGVIIPEIAISGSENAIADGDTTPDTADGTDFGDADILNETVVNTFIITNSGSDTLFLTDADPYITLTGDTADFSVSLTPSDTILPGGDTTTFRITFDPTVTGTRSATVSIANNDGDEDPYTFDIEGNGTTAPEMAITGNGNTIADGDTIPDITDYTDFSSVDVDSTSLEHWYVIENSGSDTLFLTGTDPYVTLTGDTADFSLSQVPGDTILPEGGTTTFRITFDPTIVGPRSATVSIANNDSDENPYNFKIQGIGQGAPVLDNIETTALVYDEGTGSQAITGTITIEDNDDTHLESAVIEISANYLNSEDVLVFTNTTNITGVWDGTTGILTLAGTDTKENYQTALRNVKYNNINTENPDTLTRTISLLVNDGTYESNTVTRDIEVNRMNNNAPVIAPGQVFSVDENSPIDTPLGTISVDDLDEGTVYQDWIINVNTDGDNNMAFRVNGSGIMVVNDVDEIDAEVNASFSAQVTVSDGVNTSGAVTVTININDLNDVTPVVDAAQSFTIDEGPALGTLIGTIQAGDGDITPVTLTDWTITTNADPNSNGTDALAIDTENGQLSVNDPDDFSVEADSAFNIAITVSDGELVSLPESITINVKDTTVITSSGILELSDVNVYPNPANDILNVKVDKPCVIRLFDTAGNVVLERKFAGGTQEIDVKALTPAIYYLEIQADNKKTVRKIVVTK